MDIQDIRNYNNTYKSKYQPSERLSRYIEGKSIDCLPYSLNGSDFAVMNKLGITTSQFMENKKNQYEVIKIKQEELGIFEELIGIPTATFVNSQQMVPENGIPFITKHFLDDYSKFSDLPKIHKDYYFIDNIAHKYDDIKERFPRTEFRIICNAPWSTAAKIRSVDQLLKDTRKNKSELLDLLKYSNDFIITSIEQICDKIGKTSVMIMDPISCNDLLSEVQFEKWSLPFLKEFTNEISKLTGYNPILHICGHTKKLWKFISDLNLLYFSIDNCESLKELSESYGDKLMISGNVPPLDILKFGTINDVVDGVSKCIYDGYKNKKGIVIDAGCQLPIGVPYENIEAYVYAIRKTSNEIINSESDKMILGVNNEGNNN